MGAGAIPHIRLPAIAGIGFCKLPHDAVALMFGDHRRRGDAEATGISLHHGLCRKPGRRHLVAVDQQLGDIAISGRQQILGKGFGGARHAVQRRLQNPVTVDMRHRNRHNGMPVRRACQHGMERRAARRREFL